MSRAKKNLLSVRSLLYVSWHHPLHRPIRKAESIQTYELTLKRSHLMFSDELVARAYIIGGKTEKVNRIFGAVLYSGF
jgi:hypothetical protein